MDAEIVSCVYKFTINPSNGEMVEIFNQINSKQTFAQFKILIWTLHTHAHMHYTVLDEVSNVPIFLLVILNYEGLLDSVI